MPDFPPVSPTLSDERVAYISTTTNLRGAAHNPTYIFVSTALAGDGRWLRIVVSSNDQEHDEIRKGRPGWWHEDNTNDFHKLIDDILTAIEREL